MFRYTHTRFNNVVVPHAALEESGPDNLSAGSCRFINGILSRLPAVSLYPQGHSIFSPSPESVRTSLIQVPTFVAILVPARPSRKTDVVVEKAMKQASLCSKAMQ